MTDPASQSAATPLRAGAPVSVAVLMLGTGGDIRWGNSAAGRLWHADTGQLVGRPLAALLAFEVTSSDPDFLAAQWEVVQASALDRDLPLQAQPRNGTAIEVVLRLEAHTAGGDGFIATVTPRSAPAPTEIRKGTTDFDDALRLLAERSGAGFFDLQLPNGRVHFSPAWKKLLGYLPAELADTLETWRQLIHPDDSAAAPDRLGRKIAGTVAASGAGTTRNFNVEFRMRHRRGHWIWIQSIGVQSIAAGGELERVCGLHLDITERKESEEALVANDARLQDLSTAGPLGAFEIDFAHRHFWYSPAFAALLGYGEADLAPEAAAFAAVLPPEEASAGVEAWLLARTTGSGMTVEPVRLRARDGKPVSVLLGLHRSVTRRRELTRVVGFACPLPEGAATGGNALSSPLTEEAFGALGEAVIVTDARGSVVFLNATAARLLALTREAAHGRPLGEIFQLVNRQSHRPGDDPVERALSADSPLPLIGEDALAPTAAGGVPTPIVWTARVALGPDGKALGVAVVFRNPDEMTLTPEELVKANRFESLGLLAGGIAHDFNNLLTTILGAVSLAKDNRDYSALTDGEKACLAAKGLTKQLLAFAKGGSGTQTVCGAREILEDSIKIAAAASTAEIALSVPDGTEPVLVDRAQLLQVFQNLVVNALQAMPPPPHRPRLQLHARNVTLADQQVPALPAGDYVEFEVRDNGSGIPPEYVGKIFDPFFTTKKHGTGLGLATVLSIVRKHGGQLGLDTQVGVGTAFTVFLPKAGKPVEVQARRAAALRFGTGRVLFMDDDPKISALTATMLQSLDYKYDLARNGEEAITLYKRYLNIGRPYDAVIMDLTVIGGMGGEECFGELRKLDPDVRAIVASGYDNDDLARQFLERGFCGYLTKPYRVTDLGRVLKAVLG